MPHVYTHTHTRPRRMALHCAAYSGYQDTVQLLLEAGSEVNLQDREGITALHWASSAGHTPIVNLLLSAGGSQHSLVSFHHWGKGVIEMPANVGIQRFCCVYHQECHLNKKSFPSLSTTNTCNPLTLVSLFEGLHCSLKSHSIH